MKKVNKSRYAILGMLFNEACSGYEIRRRMLSSTGHFWQESDASVYPMLKKLEAEGKVGSKEEFVGKRARKIFHITKEGKKEFLAWMMMPVKHEHPRSELLLKLFFGATVPPQNLVRYLEEKLQLCEGKKREYLRIETGVMAKVRDSHPHKRFWLMTLKNGIMHCETEIKWLKNSIQSLKE